MPYIIRLPYIIHYHSILNATIYYHISYSNIHILYLHILYTTMYNYIWYHTLPYFIWYNTKYCHILVLPYPSIYALIFQINLDFLEDSVEVSMAALLDLKGLPSIITQQAHRLPHMRLLVVEMFNSIIGHSLFTKDAIFLELMQRLKGFLGDSKIQQYCEEAREIKAYLLVTLHCAKTKQCQFISLFVSFSLCRTCWVIVGFSFFQRSTPTPPVLIRSYSISPASTVLCYSIFSASPQHTFHWDWTSTACPLASRW